LPYRRHANATYSNEPADTADKDTIDGTDSSVFETTIPKLTWPTSGVVGSGGDDDAEVSEAGIEIRVQSNRTQSSQEGWV
jgi:hypothetical protein